MNKIFIPTDFSKCAHNATLFGMHLAKAIGAKVYLYHSVPIFAGIDNNVYNAMYIEDYHESRKRKIDSLKSLLEKNEEFQGVEIEVLFSIGPSVQNIIEESEKHHADLIVMGTHGASGLTELFLGSFTANTLAHSKIPVLAIPESFHYSKMSENFVFAADFDTYEMNNKSKDALKTLAQTFNAHLKMVHVTEEKMSPDKDEEDQIADYFKKIPHKFYYLKSTHVAEAINKFSEEMEACLIATVSHKLTFIDRIFFRSVSKNIAYHSHIPLLTLYEIS